MKPSYWLCKTEPETYSFDQLRKDKKTNWNDVRNYQARNNLRKMTKGDLVLIYHSGDDKSVVGIAKVVREAYADVDPDGGDWAQVDLEAVQPFKNPVSLKRIKSTKSLGELPLIRQSRLSVMPITSKDFEMLVKLSESAES
jgi:predicted RNA-binding protein with PUA-like domain